MDIASAIITAVVAGISSSAHETASAAVKEAYAGLKQLLGGRLKSLPLLEAMPGNESVRTAAAEELRASEVQNDEAIAQQAARLNDVIMAEPRASLPQGVGIEDLNAGTDVLVKGIRGQVAISNITARTGRIDIQDISGN